MSRTRLQMLALFLGAPCLVHSQAGLVDGARQRVQRAVDVIRRDSVAIVEQHWRRVVRSGGDRREGRLAALGLATLARRTYRYGVADSLYAKLVTGAGGSGDDVATQALIGQAAGLLTRWRPVEAAALLEQARVAARQLSDASAEGEVLSMMAAYVARMGHTDSARNLMRSAAVLIPSRSALSAQRLCSHGQLTLGSSIQTADTLVSAGLALARSLGDSLALARCLVSQATLLEAQGLIQRTEEPLREAMALLAAARDWEGLGAAQQFMAYSLVTYAQQFGTGRVWAERAVRNGERVSNPLVVAWARLNIAQAALRVGDVVSVLRAARDAEATFRRIGDPRGEMSARSVGADALLLSGRVGEAVAVFRELQGQVTKLGLSNAIAPYKLKEAAGLLELGQLDAAEEAIDSAVTVATTRGLRGISNTSQYYWRGLLDLRRGSYERAIERFVQFKRGVGAAATHTNLDADLRIAEAYTRLGRFAAAESVFTVGSASLDVMRQTAVGRDDVLRLLSGLRYDTDTDLGIASIVNLFASAGRLDAAFGIAESERARWLWIQRSRRAAMARTAVAQRPLDERLLALSDAQGALPEQTAVLAYVTGRGGEPTTLFAIWRDGARAFSLPPVDSLTRSVLRLNASLEAGAAGSSLARSLGGLLLDSAMAVMPAAIRNLRLVLDGALNHLPFDALVLANGRRVLDRYVVSRAPSVRLAVTTAPPSGRARVVAYGDPVFDSRFALARLPGSAAEAEAVIRAVGGRGEARLRQAARAATLSTTSLSGASVLHLATHARVEDWGMLNNAIYLGGSVDDDGRVGAEDLATMTLGVDLVVLSGCRTVGGLVATGEGVQGLVTPLLEAGVGAVVVTQWNIRDRALTALMTRFYQAMADGTPVDEALARAKRAAMASGESPAVWAALTVIGDASVRPFAPNGRAAVPGRPTATPGRLSNERSDTSSGLSLRRGRGP